MAPVFVEPLTHSTQRNGMRRVSLLCDQLRQGFALHFSEKPNEEAVKGDVVTLHVLHVEDGLPERFFVRELLRTQPEQKVVFQITQVNRVFDALAAMDRQHFDVVLADLHLPDSFGLETIMALRAASPDTPVIIHSGTVDDAVLKDAMLCGVHHNIKKGNENPQTFGPTLKAVANASGALHV